MYYVNKDIKNTVRVFPEQGRYNYYRFDMNENPEGLPNYFVESVLKEITPNFLSVYPEPDKFLNKYSQFINVNFENIVTTNGSDMGIRYILETFGERGKKVVTVSPSFEMYWVNCNILGLVHTPVLYEDDLTINIDKILAAIDEETRIVVLLNPNNPIGNVYSEEDAEKIIEKAHKMKAIVVIDEAYHYFYKNTFLEFIKKRDNVIILRTFSKLFSLAACRLGVIISTPEIINYIKNARLTFDTNAVALLFGERILDHPEIIAQLIENEVKGKEITLELLKNKGYNVIECKGNFVFVETHNNAKDVAERLKKEKKILVKSFGNGILDKYLRISVGSPEIMKVFIDAFFQIDNQESKE